ncbi:hypothetical protein [Actinoplanes cyaneus]|nr:hypothetical protein [Actinoplanes cyaneus]MCW2139901.1 hypothetical protein [Actinoplanes cyaneus]
MRIRPRPAYAFLLALALAFSLVGALPAPAWADEYNPPGWTLPGQNIFDPDAKVDLTKRSFTYEQLAPEDLDVPEWMTEEQYLRALPDHGIRDDHDLKDEDFVEDYEAYQERMRAAGQGAQILDAQRYWLTEGYRNDPDFQRAYAAYRDGMKAHGVEAETVSEEQFWKSFGVGGQNHFLTAWRDYLDKPAGKTRKSKFSTYKNRYRNPLNARPLGEAFEGLYRTDNGVYTDPRFTVRDGKVPGVELPGKTKNGRNKNYRVDDLREKDDTAAEREWDLVVELKATADVDVKQLNDVLFWVCLEKNADLAISFIARPSPEGIQVLEKFNERLLAARREKYGAANVGKRAVYASVFPATGTARKYDAAKARLSGAIVAGGQQSWDSAATEQIADSPDDQESYDEARSITDGLVEDASASPDVDASDMAETPRPLGGVDFSTLELRYLSDTFTGAAGVKYAYHVDPDPNQKISFGGAKAAKLAADSFFTWLALPESAFTVNLNPEEPNRIVDERFGRTDAGRVLLEADFEMKKTVAKLIHPDTAAGLSYWDRLRGEQRCISMREWIVPTPATVRDNGTELFILDAPLDVKMETEYKKLSGADNCPGQATADTQHNEQVYRSLILPQVVKAVNTAPEYADLRRVYASRVAAQWYRERSATKETAYKSIVGSGDITPWVTTTGWKPKDTFDAYVKSYRDGEFTVKRTTRSGDTIYTNTYVYGGVDFTATPTAKLSADDLAARHPGVSEAVSDVSGGPATDRAGELWFGNETNELSYEDAHRPPSPPTLFWVAGLLPIALWLLAGGLLLRKRRRTATR